MKIKHLSLEECTGSVMLDLLHARATELVDLSVYFYNDDDNDILINSVELAYNDKKESWDEMDHFNSALVLLGANPDYTAAAYITYDNETGNLLISMAYNE